MNETETLPRERYCFQVAWRRIYVVYRILTRAKLINGHAFLALLSRPPPPLHRSLLHGLSETAPNSNWNLLAEPWYICMFSLLIILANSSVPVYRQIIRTVVNVAYIYVYMYINIVVIMHTAPPPYVEYSIWDRRIFIVKPHVGTGNPPILTLPQYLVPLYTWYIPYHNRNNYMIKYNLAYWASSQFPLG